MTNLIILTSGGLNIIMAIQLYRLIRKTHQLEKEASDYRASLRMAHVADFRLARLREGGL